MSSMRLPRDPRTPTGDRRTATGERVARLALDCNETMSAGLPVFAILHTSDWESDAGCGRQLESCQRSFLQHVLARNLPVLLGQV